MKNKIILIAGYPAAGKSTFSHKLAQHLNIPCFNKDTIKEVMADGFGAPNKEVLNRDKRASTATFMLLLHIAERFLQTGTICILESNFQILNPQPLSESEQIKKLLEKYNAQCLTFVLKGDLDVISERYFNRDKERHWVHERAENKDSIRHYCINTRLGEIEIGQTITIDATSFSAINYDDLYKIAQKFINS